MRKVFQRFQTNQKGFTYLSLLLGLTILLIGIGFFMALYKSTRTNMFIAREEMAMATAAQNMAQVYLATNSADTAVNQGKADGYANVDLKELKPGSSSAIPSGTVQVTITVNSNFTDSDPQHVDPYVLVFYTPQK
jgi:competence protein ComGC